MEPIKPGIYSGISNQDYHSGAGIGNSMLSKLINKTPAHYKAMIHSKFESRPSSDMVLGSAVHTALLEPHNFELEFYLKSQADYVSFSGLKKDDLIIECARLELLDEDISPFDLTCAELKEKLRQWNEEVIERFHGKLQIDELQMKKIKGMVSSIGNSKVWQSIDKSRCRIESSVYWEDKKTGLLCKVRPDLLDTENRTVYEIKTTKDASAKAFMSSVAKYGYHRQESFYLDGIDCAITQADLLYKAPNKFVFIVVESSFPYVCQSYTLDSTAKLIAYEEIRGALDLLAACKQRNEWPGYSDEEIQEITLPNWYGD